MFFSLKDLLSLRFSASSSGRFVRGLTSRAESNGSVGSLNRLVSVLSACSAGPLTHEARLPREFLRLGVNLRFRDGEAPGRKRVGWGWPREARAESVVTGTWRLMAGPDCWTVGTLREDGVVALILTLLEVVLYEMIFRTPIPTSLLG